MVNNDASARQFVVVKLFVIYNLLFNSQSLQLSNHLGYFCDMNSIAFFKKKKEGS